MSRTVDGGNAQPVQITGSDGGLLGSVTAQGLPTSTGQKTAANSTSVVPASDATFNVTTGASVALVTPAAALTASSDTTFTFASQVKHILVQNNSLTAVGMEFDAAATAGSYQVAAGAERGLDIPVTAVHMYSTAATPVNGAAALNIILKGWA